MQDLHKRLNATLRKNTLLLWISLILFVTALYLVLRLFVVRGFVEHEDDNVVDNVTRVQNAILEHIASIDSKTSDWATWDEAYAFVQNRNSRFRQQYFVPSSYKVNDLNLIAYVRQSGEIVQAAWFDPGTQKIVPVSEDLRVALSQDSILTMHREIGSSLSGILMLEDGPLLVASRPVITSQEQGPIRGSLVFGQLLDSREVQDLSRVTRVPFSFERLDDGDFPDDYRQVLDENPAVGEAVVKHVSPHTATGYLVMNDIYGRPALMLKVQMPRELYRRGINLSNYALVSLIILGIVFGLIVSNLLGRTLKQEREFDQRTTEFYRHTIISATEGKLVITDRPEIDQLCAVPIARWDIERASELSEVRKSVLNTSMSAGMQEERARAFVTAVGEALTNALKHASSGQAYLCSTENRMLFVVSDCGPGIPSLSLPHVALRGGYSTAGTLGMGYRLMISLADKIYLATGPDGTTAAIEMCLQPISLSSERKDWACY